MEYRKLISFGKSSFVVSIPKPWINKQNLKKGDVLYFEETEENLILSAKEKETDEEKKTTINNQFIYFRNHLALFEDCINCDRKSAALKKNGESKIVALLMRDQDFEKESDETQLTRGYIENIVIFMLFKL